MALGAVVAVLAVVAFSGKKSHAAEPRLHVQKICVVVIVRRDRGVAHRWRER